jgi:CRP-like cAMP-binding protein
MPDVSYISYNNTLLKSFDEELIRRLQLKRVNFKVGWEMEFPGKRVEQLFFLEEGMASMTVTFKNGSQVEVGMFGYESVAGVSALMGTKQSLNRVYTQISGWGYGCRVELAQAEFDRCGTFQRRTLRYVQAQLVQAMQSAGCNAKHSFEQRLARWLLICSDRVHRDHFKISQEFLAHMLGGTRPTVTLAAGNLKRAKLIEYTHGKIQIVDRAGLERRSCECYQAIKNHLADYEAFDTAKTA